MADGDFIIRIRALLEKGDFAAARQELTALESATKQSGTGVDDMRSKMQAAKTASFALDQALKGNLSALGSLTSATSRFTGVLGALGAVGMSFSVGWAVGKALYNAYESIAKLHKEVEKSPRLTAEARAELEKLGQVKLTALDAEIRGIQERLNKTLQAIGVVTGRTVDRLQAQGEYDIAQMEAGMPEGPDRDRAIAQRRADLQQSVLAEKEKSAQAELKAAQASRAQASAKLDELATAKERAAQSVLTLPAGVSSADRSRLRSEAATAEAAFAQQSPALQSQIGSADSAISEAQFSLGQIGLQRKTGALQAGSTLSGIGRKEAITQAQAALAAAEAAQKAGAPAGIAAMPGVEAGETAAVESQIQDLKGGKLSDKSFSYRKQMAALTTELTRQRQEEAAANEALLEAVRGLSKNVETRRRELETLTSQVNSNRP